MQSCETVTEALERRVPAVIASSIDCGRSTTGTAIAPNSASAWIPSGSTPPPTAMHGHAAGGCSLCDTECRLAEGGLRVDVTLAGDHDVRLPELLR